MSVSVSDSRRWIVRGTPSPTTSTVETVKDILYYSKGMHIHINIHNSNLHICTELSNLLKLILSESECVYEVQSVCAHVFGWKKPNLYHFKAWVMPRAAHKHTHTFSHILILTRLWGLLLYLFIYCSLKMHFLRWGKILSTFLEGWGKGNTKESMVEDGNRRGRIVRIEKREQKCKAMEI